MVEGYKPIFYALSRRYDPEDPRCILNFNDFLYWFTPNALWARRKFNNVI